MFKKLGNAYYFNGELEKAAQWYGELFMTSEVEPAYYYPMQSLRSIGEMTKQIKLWKNLIKCQETTAEKNENYMDAIKANSGRYKVEDAESIPIQIMGLLYSDKIVFASARYRKFRP
jgi:tetratricopeptide (TPR) repeat protein